MNIKELTLKLRKERSPLAATFQFHLAEIDKIGKSKGNRPTTEDETINYIKKAITTVEGNMSLAESDGHKIQLGAERNLLSRLLPEMASEDELRNFVSGLEGKSKGEIMKAVKTKYGALADMKFVSTLIQ